MYSYIKITFVKIIIQPSAGRSADYCKHEPLVITYVLFLTTRTGRRDNIFKSAKNHSSGFRHNCAFNSISATLR